MRDEGRKWLGEKGEGRREAGTLFQLGRVMERKGVFLISASSRLKGEKGALPLIDRLAEFASYVAAAQVRQGW